jgi:hypothetical protein
MRVKNMVTLTARLSRFGDGFYIFQALVCVFFDAAFDEFSGFRVQRQLAGNKKQIFCDDSLGIGPDGGRGLWGCNRTRRIVG